MHILSFHSVVILFGLTDLLQAALIPNRNGLLKKHASLLGAVDTIDNYGTPPNPLPVSIQRPSSTRLSPTTITASSSQPLTGSGTFPLPTGVIPINQTLTLNGTSSVSSTISSNWTATINKKRYLFASTTLLNQTSTTSSTPTLSTSALSPNQTSTTNGTISATATVSSNQTLSSTSSSGLSASIDFLEVESTTAVPTPPFIPTILPINPTFATSLIPSFIASRSTGSIVAPSPTRSTSDGLIFSTAFTLNPPPSFPTSQVSN